MKLFLVQEFSTEGGKPINARLVEATDVMDAPLKYSNNGFSCILTTYDFPFSDVISNATMFNPQTKQEYKCRLVSIMSGMNNEGGSNVRET